MKACSSCGETFAATAEYFSPHKDCARGLSGTCRTCKAAYHRTWKAKAGEPYRERRRQRYRETEAVATAERRRRRWDDRPLHNRASNLRQGILMRSAKGVPLDRAILTTRYLMDWLRRQPTCECCATPFAIVPEIPGRMNDRSPSIDRIDPDRGYVLGNVALLCWRCNNLKRDATSDELQVVVDWMRKVGR